MIVLTSHGGVLYQINPPCEASYQCVGSENSVVFVVKVDYAFVVIARSTCLRVLVVVYQFMLHIVTYRYSF